MSYVSLCGGPWPGRHDEREFPSNVNVEALDVIVITHGRSCACRFCATVGSDRPVDHTYTRDGRAFQYDGATPWAENAVDPFAPGALTRDGVARLLGETGRA